MRAKAAALGPAGEQWVQGLAGLLADVAAEWGVGVDGPALAGGTGSYLVGTTWEGRPAVLKLTLPDGLTGSTEFAQGVLATQTGRYLELFRVDLDRRAVLMERLGRPLSALGFTVEQQIEVLAPTLAASWRRLDDDDDAAAAFPTGAEKAAFLADSIEAWWESTGRPCSRRAVAYALECAAHRRQAFDPRTAVFVHGDAHANNVLEAVAGDPTAGFKLIDPEGLISEPAHDLAIPLRGWHDAARLSGWCSALASAAGVDTLPVWEWGFVERVSSGLFLTTLGLDAEARDFLAVADRLVGEG